MTTKRDNTSQSGFTLVELAVVLLIIGLIVGGILRGQELITSAQLNSVQTDANEIRTAVNTFQDKFVALPGDYSNATNAIDGSNLNDGNGNGRIEGDRVATASSSQEAALAWIHLAESDILDGVQDPADISSSDVDASNGLSGSVGGFWTIGQDLPTGNFADVGLSGNNTWLVLGSDSGSPSPTSAANDAGIVTDEEAAQLDRKIDDGQPSSGAVRATNSCATTDNDAGADYEVGGDNDCALGLQL